MTNISIAGFSLAWIHILRFPIDGVGWIILDGATCRKRTYVSLATSNLALILNKL